MSGWALFLLIALVLGIVFSNIMLLKHTAKMKLPKDVIQAIEKKKKKEEAEKKPTDK